MFIQTEGRHPATVLKTTYNHRKKHPKNKQNIGVLTFCHVVNCPTSRKKKKEANMYPDCLPNRKLGTILVLLSNECTTLF